MTTTTANRVTPLPLRNDTILGVCEAIGEDFGFNPLWLRLVFIAPLFLQPTATIAAYLALGLVIAASRYFFPRAVPQAVSEAVPVESAPAEQPMAIAA